MTLQRPEWMRVEAAIRDKSLVPLGVHFRLVDRCNLTCKHCYQVRGAHPEDVNRRNAACPGPHG